MTRSPLLPIFLIVLVDIFGLTLMLPLLPFYAEHFGATPFVVGFLGTTYAACQLVSGPLLGRISDRVGRRPLLLVSQAGTFIGFLILARASALWMVFLSRVIDGSTAGNLSIAQAYIADVTTHKERTRSFGLIIGVSFGLGFLVGPAVSGLLARYDYTWPIYAAAMMSATSILATWFLLPRTRPAQAREGADAPGRADPPAPSRRLSVVDWGSYVDYFRRPGLGRLLVEFFLFCLMFSTFVSGFAPFAERRYRWHGHAFGPTEVGGVLAYAGFLGLLLQGGLIGRLVKRFGESKLITAGFSSASVGYALLGLTTRVGELLGVATLSSFGNGILRPALTGVVSQRVGRHEQGVVLGLTQSLQAVAQIVAPIVGTALIDRGLLTSWAMAAAGFAALGLLLHTAARGPSAIAPAAPPRDDTTLTDP